MQRSLATVVASCVSAGWSLVMLRALSRPHLNRDDLLLLVPFAVGLAHAVAAFVTAARSSPEKARDERRRAASWFRVLGWAAACGPIFSVLAEFAGYRNGGAFFLMGMLCATPAMITALCCTAAGTAIKPAAESPVDSQLQPE